MVLEVHLEKVLPEFKLSVSFTVRRGELKVIVGPSGAGKTTIVRLIAGLERPDRGRITYNGETWVDTRKRIFIRTQKRRLGCVFQDYGLFPHLTVYGNAAFAAKRKRDVERFLKLLGIWHLRDAMPHQISGGERQRCAICQNLLREPRVLLFDEPFSALDAENRRRLRREMIALKGTLRIPIVHVTHDLREALFLGDGVLSIVQGRVVPGWLERQLEEERRDEMLAPDQACLQSATTFAIKST